MRVLAATFFVAAASSAALAAQPSAVLPHPTYRSTLPISVASNAPHAGKDAPEACDRKRVARVENATAKAVPEGVAFDAFGKAESAGWTKPQLMLAFQEHGIATVDFVGCKPEAGADVVTPVETHMGLGLAPDTRRIVIRSRTNTLSVDVR